MRTTLLGLMLLLGSALIAMPAEAAVMRVAVVETADAAAYAKNLEKTRAILKRLGIQAEVRLWRARFAGPQTGALIISVEYSDMASLGAADAKMAGDAEWQAFVAELNKIRKFTSDSLYEEVK